MPIAASHNPLGPHARGWFVWRPEHAGPWQHMPPDVWQPGVNVYEAQASYLICVDLAGVDKDQIDLTFQDGRLSIRGHRSMPAPPRDDPAPAQRRMRVHTMEIDHGPFQRVVELPADVEPERIAAQHRNGFLWIELPRRAANDP